MSEFRDNLISIMFLAKLTIFRILEFVIWLTLGILFMGCLTLLGLAALVMVMLELYKK